MWYALTLGLSLSMIVCSKWDATALTKAARHGHTDIAVTLLKAKANVNHTDRVRVR